jgi:hypothetical protein
MADRPALETRKMTTGMPDQRQPGIGSAGYPLQPRRADMAATSTLAWNAVVDNGPDNDRITMERPMIDLIARNRDEITRLCRHYDIQRLDVFGSAATGGFEPGASDIDFVVDLGTYDDMVHVRYLDLIADLEHLLGVPVHMVTRQSIRNPYFRESVEEQQELVYAAGDRQAAA